MKEEHVQPEIRHILLSDEDELSMSAQPKTPNRQETKDYLSLTTDTPEQRLMAELLTDAVVFALERTHGRYCRTKEERKELSNEAYRWILQKEGEYLISFQFACEAVGLDPDVVRARVKKAWLKVERLGKRKPKCSSRALPFPKKKKKNPPRVFIERIQKESISKIPKLRRLKTNGS